MTNKPIIIEGGFRWLGESSPPPEMIMTGPSGSEPLNKDFKWYEMSYEWVQKYKNVYTNCINCIASMKVSQEYQETYRYGINGFCWDCQKNGSVCVHLVELYEKPEIQLEQPESRLESEPRTPDWNNEWDNEWYNQWNNEPSNELNNERNDLGWDEQPIYHYRRNERELALRIPPININYEETKTNN